MTIHELLNIRLNANGVADMLRYLKEKDHVRMLYEQRNKNNFVIVEDVYLHKIN